MAIEPLEPQALRWTADLADWSSSTAGEFPPSGELIGQSRAGQAFTFALGLRRHGYHVYLAGPTGTGRTTFARRRLQQAAADLGPATDWLYLPNFQDHDTPIGVEVPAGRAAAFDQALRQLRRDLDTRLPEVFGSDAYVQARDEATGGVRLRREEILHKLQSDVAGLGFALRPSPSGLSTVPLRDGRPMTEDELGRLSPEEERQLTDASSQVERLVQAFLRQSRELEVAARETVVELQANLAALTCSPLFHALLQVFPEQPLQEHLRALQSHIRDWLPLFIVEQPPPDPGWFRVNPFVNRQNADAPVVYEANPSYYNLLGRIEYEGSLGNVRTDFTMVRPGALHRANGGYLIVPALELMADPAAYQGLKRALLHRQAVVENMGQQQALPTSRLTPAPIPLDVQVVVVGPLAAYHQLCELDEKFRKLFKIRVDFTDTMARTEPNSAALLQFIDSLRHSHGVLPCCQSGAAAVLEQAARLAGERDRLSTRMSAIIDLLVEADAYARAQNSAAIDAEAVRLALAARRERSGQTVERMLEMIADGKIRIETRGAKVGQINGLTVLMAGDGPFGLPARITARTYAGSAGVIDIEREVALSGPIHSKGVLTLSGYLGGRFGRSLPLSLSASLTIEQNYGGIDGDSASSTELYAILSDLADLPIRQDIAVTGSVDQYGNLQPIGGVNEKIEGFFAVCRAHGLTGTQGCMIPRQNASDLMLDPQVVEAARAGRFHVYAVATIQEGIELLTGVAAGQAADDGSYPAASVFGRVYERLRAYAQAVHPQPLPRRAQRNETA